LKNRFHADLPPATIVLLVFAPFASGYFLSYLLRTVNAAVAPHLMADIAVTPASLGLLTSAYFFSFAAFQLPLGMLLDRFGPRRVSAGLLALACGGSLLFGLASDIATLTIARALIGLGMSSGLMAGFKANPLWWPGDKLPRVNGWYMAVGALGSLVATAPAAMVLEHTHWRNVFFGLAALIGIAAAIVYLVVPERTGSHATGGGMAAALAGIRTVYRSRFFWTIGPATVASQSTFLAYQTLWASPWVRDVDLYDRAAAADHMFLMSASMMVGFITSGAVTEWLAKRGMTTARVAKLTMWMFFAVQLAIILRLPLPTPLLWGAFGFLGTAGATTFAAFGQHFPRELIGRANTALNLLVFAGAFLVQAGAGLIIELWQPGAGGHYPVIAHASALAGFLLLQLVTLLWFEFALRRGG
jgi:MFS family permease